MIGNGYVLNCDWMQFSIVLCESAEEKDAHSFKFEQPTGYRIFEVTGTNIYRRRLLVYREDGRKVLTILACPYSRIIPYDCALVEIANEWLYTDWHQLFELLGQIHQYTILCQSRLDICADFECSSEQYEIIKQLSTNDIYVAGKRDGSAFYSYTQEVTGIERVPRCLSWGSKHSNIKWKLYNKSAEVFEYTKDGRMCHKPWIVQQWHMAGYDDTKVWRLEVSICPAAKFSLYGRRIKVHDCLNHFRLEDIFISLYMNRYVCRRNERHKDRSNDRRVHLLQDFGQTQRIERWQNPDAGNWPVVEYAAGLNAAMLQAQKPEVKANTEMFNLWVSTAENCCRLGNLQSYFKDLYGYKIEDIRQNLQCSSSSIPLT